MLALVGGERTCPGVDFYPRDSGGSYTGTFARSTTSGGFTSFACGLDLPVGSRITDFRAVYQDQSVAGSSCSVSRHDQTDGTNDGSERMAVTGFTSGSSVTPQVLEAADVAARHSVISASASTSPSAEAHSTAQSHKD